MTTPIIDPSTLTEEQRKFLCNFYNSLKVVKDYFPDSPRVSPLNRSKSFIELLEILFGKGFFKKGE